MTKTRRAEGHIFSVAPPVLLQDVGVPPRAGVIDISHSAPEGQGWRGQKTPWALPARYTGPVLIRARRLDGEEPVHFAKTYGQHLTELAYVRGESNGANARIPGLPGRYRLLASDSQFRKDGCYGFQIDGTSFSSVVVVRIDG